jgi:hypothetical protein
MHFNVQNQMSEMVVSLSSDKFDVEKKARTADQKSDNRKAMQQIGVVRLDSPRLGDYLYAIDRRLFTF